LKREESLRERRFGEKKEVENERWRKRCGNCLVGVE